MIVAHLSDLHLSEFGDTFHDGRTRVKRSKQPSAWLDRGDVIWSEASWRVLGDARERKLTLVDPEGYEHLGIPSTEGPSADRAEVLARRACLLEARRARTLSARIPDERELVAMLERTPTNTNLRFLLAIRRLPKDIDALAITGDITDDGVGYELLLAACRDFAARKRLWVVPGNHDLYRFPFRSSVRPRPTDASKRGAFRSFLEDLRLGTEHPAIPWTVSVPEASLFVVGLDSCALPQRSFFRHTGAIGPAQRDGLRSLAALPAFRDATHRMVLMHHHLVPLARGVGFRPPTEIGMRLQDAREVAEVLDELACTLVLHGHRHISEIRLPAGLGFHLLAAPSFTLGCQSGDPPSYFRIDLRTTTPHIQRVENGLGHVKSNRADEDG